MPASSAANGRSQPSQSAARQRLAISVQGIVQGVGFRPYVFNRAQRLGLSGWVRNEADAVRIELEGPPSQIQVFLDGLRDTPPPQARIVELTVGELPIVGDDQEPDFLIHTSNLESDPSPTVPADLATCGDCLAEVRDPGERRGGYAFTNCTNCGPRWSIIRQLPYDRPRTSMAGFEMCSDCWREYTNPADRRFHAQPIACPACGPRLQLLDADGACLADASGTVRAATQALRAGQILALKGIGGFQLLADATSQTAVQRLRHRKHRPDKPFAVMVRDVDAARAVCEVNQREAEELASPAAPILLLRRKTDVPPAGTFAGALAPGNPYLGVMLPCSPLHHLILDGAGRACVCTSGNLSDEPMAVSTEQAIQRLGKIADLILTHNRPIVRPVDDSVARANAEGLQILRRARGYAPLPVRLPRAMPTVLAVGGHLKNTIALSLGRDVVISPHIGDLDNVLSIEVHERAIEDLLRFFDVPLDAVACDLHPDYASTRIAERLAAERGVPLIRCQHHETHVAACIGENPVEEPVLGLAWDGTGYGTDATVWGGEAIVWDHGRYERRAHLRKFPLPGGDAAAREPRRSALGALYEAFREIASDWGRRWFADVECQLLMQALSRPGLFPQTSSMGRLFDAVAALCGLPNRVSFEGQAAMGLEFLADPRVQDAYPLALSGRDPIVIDWQPLLESVLADLARDQAPGVISARFHNGLAEAALGIARMAGTTNVALSGGCFQNAVLADRVTRRLSADGFRVLTHRQVPPGDGGIAFGQIVLAGEQWKRK